MNPITIPILITIAVIGIIAIILVKLFYKDPEPSDLSDELPSIISRHWEEHTDENIVETEDSEKPSFVTKSWEEPMSKQQEPNNGIASKVFQEPMHSKHQDIISKDYEKEDNNSYVETNNVGINDHNKENKQSNLDSFENEESNDLNNFNDIESFEDFNFDDYDLKENNRNSSNFNETNNNNSDINSNDLNYNNNSLYNDEKDDNIDLRENDNGSFRITKSKDQDYLNNDYDTQNGYYSSNYDEHGNDNHNNENYEKYSNSYQTNEDKYSSDIKEDYNSYEEEPLDEQGVFDVGEQVIVGGKPYNIKVGDDIIFNYNGESYSSRILEIKHENIRVKYRAQEKWISFSDIKKVF